MRPKEPIDPNTPGGNSPVPIPPAEDAWVAMRKRLDEEMPVRRKRRRAFWLFFLLLPLLLWWWVERGQGRGSNQALPAAQEPPAAQEAPAATSHGSASPTPVTGASESPAAKQHTSRLSSEIPPGPAAAIPTVDPNTTDTALHSAAGRPQGLPPSGSASYPRHRSAAGRDATKPGLGNREGSTSGLTRSAIDAQLATTGARNGIEVPGPVTGMIRQHAVGNKKPNKPAKPVAPVKAPQANPPRREETRILFAAGLAVNKSFPVGAQQEVDYNANLKKDIWFDYVPTPYFQYHPGRRVALQTGLQFNSPQYTENVAIFRKTGPPIGIGSQFTQDTVVLVKKLYYFNFPLIVYFSPVRNLYLGAGIQYSGLRNGVALQNNVLHYTGSGGGQRDTVQFSKFVTLKDNAAAYGNLKKDDWRGLLELNYYWHKITLALQYQQSLDDYLHTPVPGSQGQDRNRSFNLYLRYNIWEKRVAAPPRR